MNFPLFHPLSFNPGGFGGIWLSFSRDALGCPLDAFGRLQLFELETINGDIEIQPID